MPLSEYVLRIREKIGNELLMAIAASAIAINEAGEVLLHRRLDNGLWSLPGGMVEPGEQPADAAARETMEETGVVVKPIKLVGVYGGPDFFWTYPDGNQVTFTSISFLCKPIGGEISTDNDESSEVRYFAVDQLPPNIMPLHPIRIQHAVRHEDAAYFDAPIDLAGNG